MVEVGGAKGKPKPEKLRLPQAKVPTKMRAPPTAICQVNMSEPNIIAKNAAKRGSVANIIAVRVEEIYFCPKV